MKILSACLSLAVGYASLTIMAVSAHAVMIINGDGSGNTTADTAEFGEAFNTTNMPQIGMGTGIYLNNRYVLKASHTGSGTVGSTLLGQTITSRTRLHVPGNPLQLTDIVLLELDGVPVGVSDLFIRNGPVQIGDPIRMAGRGYTRDPNMIAWNVTGGFPTIPAPVGDPWVWSETLNPLEAEMFGFKKAASATTIGTLRWGTNLVEDTDITVNFGVPNVPHTFFVTDFDAPGFGNTTFEAQGVGFDSGGPALWFNSGRNAWELVGLMHSVGLFPQQPGGNESAVFGNLTAFSDLWIYRDQLPEELFAPAIPEPGSFVILTAAGAALLLRRR